MKLFVAIPTLLLSALSARSAPAAIEVSVSPAGPLKTLQAGRDALREKRKAGATGAAVMKVAAGKYEITQPLVLDAQDSDLQIIGEGTAQIIGSQAVTNFTKHDGQILKADVSALVTKGAKYRQVFFDDQRMILARWPNFDAKNPLYGGWAFLDQMPKPVPADHSWKSEAYLKPQDLRTWAHPEDVEMDVFAQYGWWNFIQPVKGIDPTTRKLTLAKPCGYDLHPHNRFHFQNALEELDAPNEWYLDPRSNILYVWPPEPLEKHEIRLVTAQNLIKITPGTKEVRLEKLTFTGCSDNAITLDKTEQCVVVGCSFLNVGGMNGSAISINGGLGNEARSNEINGAGNNGISLGGGDRPTLTACENKAINNHIHHMGVFNKNACGVSAYGVGITIAHNLIHDGPRMGVQMSGNNIIVEYNHLHHLVLETQDGGAVYTGGRDWISSRGSAWRYNRAHDIIGCGQEADGLHVPWFTFGLYPDDNTGGVDIIGNLVHRCEWTPIHLHNSRDCIVENNIFAYGNKFQFDLHGWTKDQHYWIDHGPTMVKGYESVIGQPAWKSMRGMELHPKDAFREDGTMMSGDVVQRNIMLSNKPGIKYGDLRNVSPKYNTIDYNLAWNGGHPVSTGITAVGKDVGEPLLMEAFDTAAANKTPSGWGFNHMPNKSVRCIVEAGALVVDAALGQDTKNTHTVFHGPNLPIKEGAAYRVKLRVKSEQGNSPIAIAFASFENGKGYWQSSAKSIVATPSWQTIEVAGRMPKTGEAQWKDWMKTFWLRIDCNGDKDRISVDDVTITEAEAMDEWASWQAAGWDKHSLVADPKFIDPENGDFRMKPDSPAITKLGFKPLPLDQMGLTEAVWKKDSPVKFPGGPR